MNIRFITTSFSIGFMTENLSKFVRINMLHNLVSLSKSDEVKKDNIKVNDNNDIIEYTKESALATLEEKKKLLELELINQDEYNDWKEKLKQFIL